MTSKESRGGERKEKRRKKKGGFAQKQYPEVAIYLVHFDRVIGGEKLYPKLDVHIFCRPVLTKASIKSSGLQQVEDELFPGHINIQEACHTTVPMLVTLERFEPGKRHGTRSNARSKRRRNCLPKECLYVLYGCVVAS